MNDFDFDLAVLGSGFSASLLAMIARRLGLRVMLLERGRHPRFAIGESASPLAGAILQDLAARYDLPRVAPLAAYGAWQRTCPQLVCGLKRGFTYFKHEADRPYRAAPDRSNQLLVAASPADEVSDTHWLRSDVDHFLVREAMELGAEYLDGVHVDGIAWEADGAPAIGGTRGGRSIRVRARAVIDGTGPRGALSRVLGLADAGFAAYPGTQALFSHFTAVVRCDAMPEYASADAPPYPIDAAALHHVFDEGWMWVLRFGNGVTSAGVAVTDRLAVELRLADGAPAWKRLLARYPSVAAQFARAEPIREFTWMPRLASRVSAAAGQRWAMLPSAAAFVDPLFSTGIPLTLLGVERLGRMLESGRWRGAGSSGLPAAAAYSDLTLAEADHAARFIAGCYAGFPSFELFTAYSMFYFAAASFSEVARRLGRHEVAPLFLGAANAPFAAAMARLSPVHGRRRPARADFERDVAGAIECLNVAGLCDPARRNWYGVDLNDTVRGAAKLGVTPDVVSARLGSLFTAAAEPRL